MDWNAKPLGQWDWEHFFFMNGKATENPKLQPSTDWLGEADREANIGALYPSGGSGCSVSELFHASFSRSSKSASNNSSSNGDSKSSMLTQEGSQDGSTAKKELLVETSPTTEPSAVSGEPLLTLKLGKRFYFEDVSIGSGSKKLASSAVLLSGKKGKSGQNLIPASCQVEGCGLDLSSAKDYHRKHRVCETHSKSPMVVIDGFERRFCQQCSRFHALPEFDDQKRSCRRRLADHNARRRKPQPEAVQLNPPALPLSPYGTNLKNGRQVMGPYAFSRNATNLAWHEHDIRSTSSKLPQTKDFLLKPTKDFHKMPNTTLSDDSSGLLASKGIGTKTTFPGIEDPNDTQDVNRALSLLSTNSWDAYETKSLSLQHSDPTTGITQTRTHTVSQCLPLPSSEYWHTDHQLANSGTCVPYLDYDNSSRFQDFQLLNAAPFESSFPCNGLD